MRESRDTAIALQDWRATAKRILGKDITFDWELQRTPLGQYMWQWSKKAVIDRCFLAAPLGDVTWNRQDKEDMHGFYTALREAYLNRLPAFAYTGTYDFSKGVSSPEEVETLPADIAKWGIGLSLHAKQFAERFKQEGIAGYMRNVAAPAIEAWLPISLGGQSHLADTSPMRSLMLLDQGRSRNASERGS
ncbi:isocitrate lyase [Colletotrichum scovillei]|uniref:methylisocitrate lyase n=1 Tax=Colletotrichum scovillei TaxID=1209932 RepID=A0A9P7RA53_9PEZI|nr:isocitrate lyase [Colletotrichum scovillei]KAG7072041.1 isocitrate lyase [Colletotrichum scovillei]KAG7080280.1 isocitrate lyase [Colletotrichum scovillei]